MSKMNGTAMLSLFLFLIQNATTLGDPKIILYSVSATPQDVNLLNLITPGQELPLIFFLKPTSVDLEYPIGLNQVEIESGRIWSSGTELYATPSANRQIALCPNSDATQQCLVVKLFGQQSQILQCDTELKPRLYNTTYKLSPLKGCGLQQDGLLLSFGYKICGNEVRLISILSFCFRQNHEEIVFAQYTLNSPNLLDEKLLTREQQIVYNENEISGLNPRSPFLAHRARLDYIIKKMPAYRLQYLIPPENMAFAAWKKATYHYANQALQHGALFELWNDINRLIRNDVIKWSGVPRKIITGIIKIPENQITTPWVESNLYNIWVTVVTEFDEITPPTKALVILMNNFTTQPSNINYLADGSANFRPQSQYIDKLCGNGRSFCVQRLKQKFTHVGGEVRCCKLTTPIMKLFSINGIFTVLLPDTLLRIENINAIPVIRLG